MRTVTTEQAALLLYQNRSRRDVFCAVSVQQGRRWIGMRVPLSGEERLCASSSYTCHGVLIGLNGNRYHLIHRSDTGAWEVRSWNYRKVWVAQTPEFMHREIAA